MPLVIIDFDLLFTFGSFASLIGFLLLIFAPGEKLTSRFTFFVPLLQSFIYSLLVLDSILLGLFNIATFTSLYHLRLHIGGHEIVTLAGWLHYLCFDLFIGRWLVSDARRHGIKHVFVVPCLLLCYTFGPSGFLLYHLIKWASKGDAKYD